MNERVRTESTGTVIIGGGQAGLAVGYHLSRLGLPFVIVDGNERVGDSWRKRWNSLRLFTPARFDGLPGLRFPAHGDYFPTKDEMADYLESYAREFELPLRLGRRVDSVTRQGEQFVVAAGDKRFEANQVVVAMASYQRPKVPEFANELASGIRQLHSSDYRGPEDLQPGKVLIAGAGNSGAEIAKELSRTHEVILAGRYTGSLPFRIDGLASRLVMARLVLRVLFHRVLTLDSPIGRKAMPKITSKGGPLIRVRPKELEAAGVRWEGRVVGVREGMPVLASGETVDVENIVWSTGYSPDLTWLHLPSLNGGKPRHQRGVVHDEPGLFFVGLTFLYAMSSTMIHGVGRDAEYVAQAVAARALQTAPAPVGSGTAPEAAGIS